MTPKGPTRPSGAIRPGPRCERRRADGCRCSCCRVGCGYGVAGRRRPRTVAGAAVRSRHGGLLQRPGGADGSAGLGAEPARDVDVRGVPQRDVRTTATAAVSPYPPRTAPDPGGGSLCKRDGVDGSPQSDASNALVCRTMTDTVSADRLIPDILRELGRQVSFDSGPLTMAQ